MDAGRNSGCTKQSMRPVRMVRAGIVYPTFFFFATFPAKTNEKPDETLFSPVRKRAPIDCELFCTGHGGATYKVHIPRENARTAPLSPLCFLCGGRFYPARARTRFCKKKKRAVSRPFPKFLATAFFADADAAAAIKQSDHQQQAAGIHADAEFFASVAAAAAGQEQNEQQQPGAVAAATGATVRTKQTLKHICTSCAKNFALLVLQYGI